MPRKKAISDLAPETGSKLERKFSLLWENVVLSRMPGLVLRSQHVFWPSRKWAFDFARPECRVAVELDGLFSIDKFTGERETGRHLRVGGFVEDCSKFNAASAAQWLVFRFTTKHMKSCPVQCVELVWSMICCREGLVYVGDSIPDAGRMVVPARKRRRR